MAKNTNAIVGAVTLGIAAACSIVNVIEIAANERAKRAKIKEEATLQIRALRDAAVTVRERMAVDYYGKLPSTEAVLTDLQFQTIVNRYEK